MSIASQIVVSGLPHLLVIAREGVCFTSLIDVADDAVPCLFGPTSEGATGAKGRWLPKIQRKAPQRGDVRIQHADGRVEVLKDVELKDYLPGGAKR